jgi:hypothetical protein
MIRRSPAEAARQNPRSRRFAINAKCFDCQGGDADPCWQWRVGNCDISSCGLYPLRPHQRMAGKPVPPSLSCSEVGEAVSTESYGLNGHGEHSGSKNGKS